MDGSSFSLSFGRLLRQYRRAAGLTQERLAEQAGYSAIYLRKLERDERRPLPVTVEVLAAALRLGPEEREQLQAAAQRSTVLPIQARQPRQPGAAPAQEGVPPLVGRVQELAWLKQQLSQNSPRLLVLAGEPGIGKTRLLQEAARLAQEQGWNIYAGGCHRRSAQEPYAPFVDLLAQALAQRTPEEQKRALAGCSWLVRLLPELAESGLLSSPAWALPADQERRRLFAAVGQLLNNLAGPAGTLLVLDDLQWAGTDALDLLASLLRSPMGKGVRVVAAYRATEVRTADALGTLLADLVREGLAARKELGPLADEEARALLGTLLAEAETDVRDAVLDRMVVRTGGVPYFLVSCAQELRAEAASRLAPPEEQRIPWSVAESIRQRVALLPEAAQMLLGAASVVGREADMALLLALAAPLEWSRREMLAALELACQARLLREQHGEKYAFAHDLIWEVISGDLSAARRAVLHQQVAEALEQQPGELPAETLAYHYRRAGLLEKAVAYLERAGDRAQALCAHAEAERSYRELVALLTQLGRPRETAAAQEKLARVLNIQARFGEALAAQEAAFATYQTLNDPIATARAIGRIGLLEKNRGRPETAIARLQSWLATTDISTLPPESQGILYLHLTSLFQDAGRFQESLAAAQTAIACIQQAEDQHLLGQAREYLGRSLVLLNRVGEAIPQFEAALPLVEREGDPRSLFYVFLNLSLAEQIHGTFQDAIAHAERARTLAEQLSDSVLLGIALNVVGSAAFQLGQWQPSRAAFEHSVALMRQAGLPWGTAHSLTSLGVQLMVEGHWNQAAAYVEEALALAEQEQNLDALRWCHSALAERELLLGQPQAAYDRLKPLLDHPHQEGNGMAFVLMTLAWAVLELGQLDGAQQMLDQVLAEAKEQQLYPLLAEALGVQARLAARRGQSQAAEQALCEALKHAREMHTPYTEAKICYIAGLIALQQHETVHAREQLESALALLQQLGERLYAEQAGQALALISAAR